MPWVSQAQPAGQPWLALYCYSRFCQSGCQPRRSCSHRNNRDYAEDWKPNATWHSVIVRLLAEVRRHRAGVFYAQEGTHTYSSSTAIPSPSGASADHPVEGALPSDYGRGRLRQPPRQNPLQPQIPKPSRCRRLGGEDATRILSGENAQAGELGNHQRAIFLS